MGQYPGYCEQRQILKQFVGQANAIRAEELLSMNKEACRELVRDNDVVYITTTASMPRGIIKYLKNEY